MSLRAAWFVAAAVTIAVPVAGADRVVNYAIDEATSARDAMAEGVVLAPLPLRGTTHIAVQIAPGVDHQVMRVGVFCSAWKVQNPISGLLQRFLTAWDRDDAPASSPGPLVGLLVKVDRGATLSRCVGTGELKTSCITRVSIDGTATRPGEDPRPFHIEREEAAKTGGLCSGLTLGIGLISRQAASALVKELNEDRSPSHVAS